MEHEAYRHVPYDIDVEQALLGAILADNRAMERVSALVKSEHFYDPLHGRIYETMSQMIERGGVVVTPLTLHATMKSDPGVIETGGQAYFDALRAAAPAIPNVRDYADILSRPSGAAQPDPHRRGYRQQPPMTRPPRSPRATQIAEAEKALYAVAETNKYGEGALDFHQALRRAVESAERAHARGGRISGITSGFTDIDALLGGLQPSDLLILAGRPGMGKTALGTNMAFHAAPAIYARPGSRRRISQRRAGAVLLPGNGGAAAARRVFCPNRPSWKCGRSATASSAKASGRNSCSPCRSCRPCRFISTIPAASPSPRSPPAPAA